MAWDGGPGDEPAPAWRDQAPDRRSPIDPNAPVSGHGAPGPRGPSPADAPEQDWTAAMPRLFPVLRPLDSRGTRLADLEPARLATEGLKTHADPVVDDGPAGIPVAYAIRAEAFDVLVNADHLLAWGVGPEALRSAAIANLAAWSAAAPWSDEASGRRQLRFSASGGGGDAARILLPEVLAHLGTELGREGRVLVGLPGRDLLVAGALVPGDDEFAALFAEFVREQAVDADEPIDRRVLELVDGRIVPFAG